MSSGGISGRAVLGPQFPAGPLLRMTLQYSFGGLDNWTLTEEVTYYVDPSQQPTIDVFGDSGHVLPGAINAAITGYLVSLP